MGTIVLTGPILFGQVAEQDLNKAVMLITIAGMALLALVVGLPVVLGIWSERRRREMEHAERMRAIELGRPIPGEAGWWTPPRLVVAIGVGVPIAVFAIGFVAALAVADAAPFVWPSAGAVGLAAVICGTVLAARLPSPQPTAPDRAKPVVDPDAYELTEHRHS